MAKNKKTLIGIFSTVLLTSAIAIPVAIVFHKNIEIIEVGYQCGLRMHGMSKTGSSLVGLVRLGRPYIKAALKSRRS